jgi:hypothetical protein
MAHNISGLATALQQILLGLQAFQVAFLWIHDWVPLGRLNDVEAVRREDPLARLAGVTLLQSLPFTVGLVYSVRYLGQQYPGWLESWLMISYTLLFVGQIRAWWVPYLVKADPKRAERFSRMFGNTHSFLPIRNGLVPNTAHILLHISTVAKLVVLLVSRYQR